MKNPTPEYARGVCSLHGLIIVEKGISLTNLTMMTKAFPDSFVSDHVLAQACFAACVFGELNNCESARSELGIVSPEAKPVFDKDALQVIPPKFDEEHGWAARCLYPGMHEFASAFIDAFENSGATNFLSLDFWSKSNERFQVVIQKVGKLTPTDRWKATEEELAELKSTTIDREDVLKVAKELRWGAEFVSNPGGFYYHKETTPENWLRGLADELEQELKEEEGS